MNSFGQDIWTVDGDVVRMYGLVPFATRMTVVRLGGGGVWVHSPVQSNAERQGFVDRLGAVEHLVAPNKIHSIGIRPWQALYPAGKVWVSPGFSKRHPDIATDATLENGVRTDWSDDIDHCVLEGHAVLDEVVFLHRPSGTLIVTDFIQKHEAAGETWLWRGIKGLAGILGRDGGVPPDIRLSVSDKAAMKRSVQTVLGWDFDNLIISHGHCRKGGAKDEVRRVLDWIAGD